MIETFVALLLAHVLADFVLQTSWMAQAKAVRHVGAFAAHGAVVAVTAALALGAGGPQALAAVGTLCVAHLAIDLAKTWAPHGLGAFLADQTAHLVSLAVVAGLMPELWATGAWAGIAPLSGAMALAAGAVLAVRAGQFAVGLLMDGFGKPSGMETGLPGAGAAIGVLERGLVFLLVIAGQPGGIGFLIAAKSILRFGTVGSDREVSEYVIIGTLASFGWALAVAVATLWLMSALSPLGIPDLLS